jgi:hypothetical protein
MIEAHGHHKQAQTFVDMHVRPELPRESLSGDVREALPGLHDNAGDLLLMLDEPT